MFRNLQSKLWIIIKSINADVAPAREHIVAMNLYFKPGARGAVNKRGNYIARARFHCIYIYTYICASCVKWAVQLSTHSERAANCIADNWFIEISTGSYTAARNMQLPKSCAIYPRGAGNPISTISWGRGGGGGDLLAHRLQFNM